MIGFAPEMRKIKEKRNSADKLSCCACVRICRLANLFLSPTSKKKKEHSFYSCFFFAFWQVGCQKNATFFFLRHFSEADLSPEAVNRKRGPSQKKKRKKQKLKKKLGKSKPRLWNISIFFLIGFGTRKTQCNKKIFNFLFLIKFNGTFVKTCCKMEILNWFYQIYRVKTQFNYSSRWSMKIHSMNIS